MRRLLVLFVLTSAAFIISCTGPTYKTEYYTLTADDQADLRIAKSYTTSLGVGPIQLPETLKHAGIVSLKNSQQVLVAPYDVWAGDLKEAMTRVLADDLSIYLGSDDVWPFPWDNRARPEQQVRLVFERFGGERGGAVELQAKWRLLSSNGDQVLYSDKVNLQTEAQGNSYNAYVGALNELLNQLAEAIAVVIAKRGS